MPDVRRVGTRPGRDPTHPDAGPIHPGPGDDFMTSDDVLAPSTEADQLRAQLLQAQRLSSVGALASSVAHEFNNILTTIINYARLGMRAENDPAARTQAFEKILKGGQHAATIVNSMLGFARNHSTQPQLTDLARLADEVLLLAGKDLSKHRIQVDKKVVDRPQVHVVPGQIEQILLNLVINARQAMPNGGRLRVEVRSNRRTGMAEIRIADSGVGISPDKL